MLLRDSPSSGPDERPRRRQRRAWRLWAALVTLTLGVAVVALPPVRERAPGGEAVTDALAQRGDVDDRPAPADRPALQVVGYVPYWQQPAAVADVTANRGWLTTVAPWWYSPTADGDVVEQHPAYTDTGDGAVQRLRDAGMTIMPTIANHRDGAWDFAVVPTLIADDGTRSRHVRALAELVATRDFDGIVIDYELLEADDRDNFTAFVTELGEALHADGKRLAVALHAQRSDAGDGGHNQAQDYAAIGAAVDEIHLMTYNQHYDGSQPGPVAPLPWVSDVIAYALTHVPAHKLILGIGLFGYDWGGGRVAEDLQLTQVDRRIASTGQAPRFDDASASPFVRYRRDGVDRELWYEDARSVEAKLALVERHRLGGAFFWRLGAVPDDIWRAAARVLDDS
ncbi:glycosyl hydrolase family 18 protein [soil metagenome]